MFKYGLNLGKKRETFTDQSNSNLQVIDDEQIQEILTTIDVDENGSIEFSEFLAYSLTRKQLSEDNIRILFEDIMQFSKLDDKEGPFKKCDESDGVEDHQPFMALSRRTNEKNSDSECS